MSDDSLNMPLMLSTSHRQYVRALYKSLLSEAGMFFDDRARLVGRQHELAIFS
jgi:hypothetical protein